MTLIVGKLATSNTSGNNPGNGGTFLFKGTTCYMVSGGTGGTPFAGSN